MKRLFVLASVLLLAACYPTYNWRELPVADGLATLAFPAKVDTAKRQIDLAGMPVTFVLTSTDVNDVVFSIGWAQLPMQSTPEQREAAKQSLVDSLAASIGKSPPDSAYNAEVFRLENNRDGKSLALVAKVLVHYDIVMRVVASGPPDVLTDGLANEFMRSLKLR
ncbi:MAG: hypothetical protein LRY53_03180 [Burkholderiaceae bacterium]|nr:hypothetical protein [Burkholderiaceae bacterium]MCD8517802.1 hypothetical protein [Burkholderiaceae bacterium]MCD8537238.1 hypothetical protein [Burkholderiaceae bacterium]MCD8564654.1 hypothetical protein [Burkholderiaceae bacterium]